MKTYLYPFLSITLILSLLTGLSSCKKKKCKAVFPTLEYDISNVMQWDTSRYCNLTFQFYTGSVEDAAPWQLICYGLEAPVNGKIGSSKKYDKLRVSSTQDSTHYKDSVIAGNNVIPLKLLQSFASAALATDSHAKVLIFIPYDDDKGYENYILYHIKVLNPNPANGKFLQLDPTKITPDLQPYIKVDPIDGINYLELNPCPPANMLVSNINPFNIYGFFAPDTRLVRGMVIAGADSNTMLETSPNAG